MTIATIGRRMKNSATATLRASRPASPDGLHLHAGPHPLHPLDDHPLAGLEPVRHDVEVADALVDRHGPERRPCRRPPPPAPSWRPAAPARRAAARGWRWAARSMTPRTRANWPGRSQLVGVGKLGAHADGPASWCRPRGPRRRPGPSGATGCRPPGRARAAAADRRARPWTSSADPRREPQVVGLGDARNRRRSGSPRRRWRAASGSALPTRLPRSTWILPMMPLIGAVDRRVAEVEVRLDDRRLRGLDGGLGELDLGALSELGVLQRRRLGASTPAAATFSAATDVSRSCCGIARASASGL